MKRFESIANAVFILVVAAIIVVGVIDIVRGSSAQAASVNTTVEVDRNFGLVGRYQICPDAKFLKFFYMVDTCTGRVWRVEEEPRTWKWVAKIILQEAPQ